MSILPYESSPRRASPTAVANVRSPTNAEQSPPMSSSIVSLVARRVRWHLTEVKTSVSTKGQVVLPAELRAQDDIKPGQEFAIERIDRGQYRLLRLEARNEGLVDWLLSCPDKGYFVPIESESTDTL